MTLHSIAAIQIAQDFGGDSTIAEMQSLVRPVRIVSRRQRAIALYLFILVIAASWPAKQELSSVLRRALLESGAKARTELTAYLFLLAEINPSTRRQRLAYQ